MMTIAAYWIPSLLEQLPYIVKAAQRHVIF